MFIAQKLLGPNKQLKQVIQIERRNPNWLEANQLTCGRGFQLEATVKQIQVVVGGDSSPRDRWVASPMWSRPIRSDPISSPEPTILLIFGRDRELLRETIFWACAEHSSRILSQSDLLEWTGSPWIADWLDEARALDPCRRSEGSWALGTRMPCVCVWRWSIPMRLLKPRL